jgi:hypothetical protein
MLCQQPVRRSSPPYRQPGDPLEPLESSPVTFQWSCARARPADPPDFLYPPWGRPALLHGWIDWHRTRPHYRAVGRRSFWGIRGLRLEGGSRTPASGLGRSGRNHESPTAFRRCGALERYRDNQGLERFAPRGPVLVQPAKGADELRTELSEKTQQVIGIQFAPTHSASSLSVAAPAATATIIAAAEASSATSSWSLSCRNTSRTARASRLLPSGKQWPRASPYP